MRIHSPDASSIVLPLLVIGGPMTLAGVFMLVYSLGGIGLLSPGWTLIHWRLVLSDPQTWISLAYSAYVGAASLAGSIVFALAIVFSLGALLRRGALGTLIYLPLTIPPIVAGFLTAELFGGAGLLSRVAYQLGWIARPADFPVLVYSRWGIGIILAHFFLVTPFLVLLFDRLRRNERVDALMQLAQTLGASRWQTLRRVALPVMLCAARPALSVYLIVLIGAFEVPLLIGAQSPSMISVLIWNRFARFDLATRPQAFVLTTLYTVIMVTALLIVRRSRVGLDRGER